MKRIQNTEWLLIIGYSDGRRDYITCNSREEASRRRNEMSMSHLRSQIDPAVTVITPIERGSCAASNAYQSQPARV